METAQAKDESQNEYEELKPEDLNKPYENLDIEKDTEVKEAVYFEGRSSELLDEPVSAEIHVELKSGQTTQTSRQTEPKIELPCRVSAGRGEQRIWRWGFWIMMVICWILIITVTVLATLLHLKLTEVGMVHNQNKNLKERSNLTQTELGQLENVVSGLNKTVEKYRSEKATFLKNFQSLITDCHDLYRSGVNRSGIYSIQPQNSPVFQAFCDMDDGAGWTVIMKRFDGSLDFDLPWADYKTGFGDLTHEFWLGNDKLYLLTNQQKYTLKVEYVEWATNQSYYVTYSMFRVEDEANKYKLHVSGFHGNGSNGLYGHSDPRYRHDGMSFSSIDRDNDRWIDGSCARSVKGGFWYNICYGAYPTGPYTGSGACMAWYYPTCTRSQTWKIKPATSK